MKRLAFLLALTVASLPSQASVPGPFVWQVVRVLDGDTLEIRPPWLLKGLRLSVRIYGIDAPEVAPHAHCRKEAILGERATALTAVNIATAKTTTFRDVEWDKYGGRILAKVSVDGKDLGQELIAAGLAHSYFGDKKPAGYWCKRKVTP